MKCLLKFSGIPVEIGFILEEAVDNDPHSQKDQCNEYQVDTPEPSIDRFLFRSFFHAFSLSVVIGFPFHNGECPVKLFHKNYPYQLVGESEF